MLLHFEIKRMIEGKEWLGMVLGMVVMIVAAIINSIVVQPMFEGSVSIQYDYYCGVSQLMPFVFAPSIGNYFTKDYEDKSYYFYKNIGIPLRTYHLNRLFVASMFGTGIIILGTGLYFFKEKTSFISSIGVLIILILQYIYTILLSGLVAFFTKKRIITTVAIIFGTMILSVFNVLPIPSVKGYIFMLDGHSIITDNIKQYLIYNDLSCFQSSIFIMAIWIILFYIIYYAGIMIRQKGQK